MRILVTGGAGFIGSHVSDALLAGGHQVTVVDDLSTGRRGNVPHGADFVKADIRDADAVARLFSDAKPEVVCHQAAQTSVSISTREPLRDAEINVLGGLNLLQQCVSSKVNRFVFASTGGAIYGEVPEGERATVATPPRPLSPYACSKHAFEGYLGAYAYEHDLEPVILRYANVYGPRQDPHGEAGVVAIFCQRLLAGESIRVNARREPGDPGCVRDYVHVDDVVRANVMAVNGELNVPVLNVCTGTPTTTLQLAQGLEVALGRPAELTHGPRREGDVERSVLDPGPDSPLGATVELAAGLAGTLDWFRQGGG